MNERRESKYRILLIEDDPAISNVVELNLKLDNYEVFLAADGEEGLNMVAETDPDLVILDVMMAQDGRLAGAHAAQVGRQDQRYTGDHAHGH